MLDVVIRGGEVVDGTGSARRQADVGILDGQVVQVGEVTDSARRTIDAEGKIVAPGFIDVHTHYDIQAFWDPLLSPSPLHGVTTVLGGNCGFSVAPIDSESSDYMMRTLARVEGMPLEALESGAPWDWKSTAEYLDALDGTLALNAGFMVGHTAIRRVVMGEDATKRFSTPDELEAMATLLRQGLRAGGMGFSTSRGRAHQDANGDAVPSRHASAEEFVALAAICRDYPGTSIEFIPHHSPFSDEDRDIALSMTVAAQRPINWNLINANAANLDSHLLALELSDEAAARGGKIVALAIPMDVSGRLTFATGFALDMIPGWTKNMVKPAPERLALLRDPATRERMKAQAKIPGAHTDLADWGQKIIVTVLNPKLKHYEGRIVADIAAEEGKDPFDALLDIVCADELATTFSRLPKDSRADWEARAKIWRDERTLIGGSDAGAHLDFLATFQYATTLLSSGVRDHEVFTLEEAVEQITSRPADLYGLRDRGRLIPGTRADVVIFDETQVASGPTVTRNDLPGGAARFYAEAIGVDEVMVNGETVVAACEFTGARPGTLLRSGKDTMTPSLS